ncbi:hypothetical protein BDB00DRAFT_821201 [Zychaea mexicana]|uniref:uncharacterized protein n=1 Tax=Zychaea mexicana TaxID=64656 RepID=UPI0022FDFF98|nr:uncharacterized protein BDB00DRAFT_821201 [Zychaea mexicana]KAI9493907.1 hypothetical protein BDB00DRAFT_821201 [Zychaea mexicana]
MEPENAQSPIEQQEQPVVSKESGMNVDDQGNAAPGVWEVTKGSRNKAQEDDKPAELTEEQQNEQTLNTLDEMTKIMEELDQDKGRYDLHVRLIELLQQMSMEDELERAREQMHEVYPLSEDMWLDWINDLKKKENTEEKQERLRWLYVEATRDYFSIPIWESFVDYTLEQFDNKWEDKQVVEDTRENLVRAVRATEHHISQSQRIWIKFIEFETQALKVKDSMQQDFDPKQLERVKQLYRDRLDTLHTSSEETFNKYSTFNTNFDNQNYEQSMLKANKIYSKVKEAAEVRDQFELQLKQTNNALDTFYEYISNESINKDKYSLNNIRNLYERAVAIYCTDVTLWDNYVTFLLERVRVPVFMESITHRAIRNCPWSGILWGHHARSLEANKKTKEEIIAIFDTALGNQILLSSLEDLVNLFRAKCDYLRRRIDWTDPSEDDTVDLRVAFEEALVYLDEKFPKTPDPYFRIERYYAFVENELLDNEDKAREIWENRVSKRHGRCTDAWLSYIEFERSCGNLLKCQSLYKQAIVKNLDDPQRLINAWLNMTHEIGTLDMLEDALVKVKQKEGALLHQWQGQAVELEAEKQREEEKKIKQKKLKAQRRAQTRTNKRDQRDLEEDVLKEEKEEEAQKDSDGFKIPAPPRKRQASSQSDEPIDAPTLKKTKIDHVDPEENRRDQTDRGRGRSLGRGRGRGRGGSRGRGRVGLGFNARKSTTAAEGSNSSNDDNSEQQKQQDSTKQKAGPSLPADAKPKTQDDFRAMLLGKK